MAHEEHKIAQDGQDKRQDEARWRQDAKNEGCLERFRPLSGLRPRTTCQQVCGPGAWGGVGEGINPLPRYRGKCGLEIYPLSPSIYTP